MMYDHGEFNSISIEAANFFIFSGPDEFIAQAQGLDPKISEIKRLTHSLVEIMPFNPLAISLPLSNATDLVDLKKLLPWVGIPYEIGTQDVVRNWYSEVRELTQEIRFFDLDMGTEMSTGESSLVNLFSRLWYVKENIVLRSQNLVVSHVKIFIDEGEIGLHPDWQRKYLFWLVEYLRTNFSEYTIQLLLTSHSPFLLSDIPSQNVIALEKDENRMCSPTRLNDIKTFGANIHLLLANGFFMKEGSIGLFAEKKINDLISRTLEARDYSHHELSKIKEEINLIGEPLIAAQLKLQVERQQVEYWRQRATDAENQNP